MRVVKKLETIRERWIVTHKSDVERDVELEITLSNESDDTIKDIILESPVFMPALKVVDSSHDELVYYTNAHTRRLLNESLQHPESGIGINIKQLLERIDKHEIFVIWIRLPDDAPINKGEPRIIKLCFRDPTHPPTERQKLDIFSIPEYEDRYTKPKGVTYDIFYIITVPENNKIEYKIIEKTKFETETKGDGINRKEFTKKAELTEADRMYENPRVHSLSIRLPPLDEQIDFRIRYKVVPGSSERQFFQTVIFLLIGTSVFFSLISTGIIDSQWSFIFKRIEQHMNAFFGGIVTISVAAIGFSNKPMLNKTRFWFIVPIMISAIGFLLKKEI